jgi:hypothetical protein
MKKLPALAGLLTLLIAANCFAVSQDESEVTPAEKAQVQQFAKRFVARLLQTRDVGRLIPEFFLPDFTSLSQHDYYQKVSPQLYAKLSSAERERLFVVQENLGYLITLDVMTQSDPNTDAPFSQILPAAIAKRLNRSRLVEDGAQFTRRAELMKELTALERTLRKARVHLKKRDLEHSSRFVDKMQRFERNPNLGYRVRASVIDAELKREVGLEKFAIGQKVFSVETPILIELVLINEDGRLRILTLLAADDD